ncbi:hypothetical protein [Nocardiopsis ansamitocini]|uniref:Secreted protein n=1 Tax=Nocardiopsis ansamitocini TaxID=1670832 RepID=A0A9W6PAE1_9ACTN|nr:hypothetical protein [Nocardiopsis ansamitocini]GLU49959.1 hypothetical protein Nans01_43100 [Nocardiopsis ansamitocini]
MRKSLFSLVAGAALVAGTFAGPSSAAAADEVGAAATWPQNCTYKQHKNQYGSVGTRANCKSGGGQYRAAVICTPIKGGVGVTRLAPVWRKPGSGYSYVYCPPETVYSSSGVEKRAG